MSEPRLTPAWCWSPDPPASPTNAWQVECYANGSHIVVYAETQQAAQDKLYLDHPELRGIVRWVFEAPPRPKRPDEKPTAPAIENLTSTERNERLTECFRRWSKRLHPDTHSGDMLATEAMAALSELYELAKQ